jgi:hypothetical protein
LPSWSGSLQQNRQGCKWVCDDHGEKMRGWATCGLPYDPFCLTDAARDLDKARLPDLDPETGEAYRSVWLLGRYPLPTDLAEWKAELLRLQELWGKSIGDLQRRKAVKNMLHWRSFTVYYTPSEALIHWKFMVKESAPGAADKALAGLGKTMGAEVYDDRRYVHGELASLQLVENARSHLLGFSRDLTWEGKLALFGAHYEATKGRHVFQALGPLKSRLDEVRKKREPLKCDECGKKLRQILEPLEARASGEETVVGNRAYGPGPPGRGSPGGEVAA